jgi:2-isopropylmalate synthase
VAQLTVRAERREAAAAGTAQSSIVAALGTSGGPTFELADYAEHSATPGAGAQAVAYVAVRTAPVVRYGAGRHEDVVLATYRAVVSACNRAQAALNALAPPTYK